MRLNDTLKQKYKHEECPQVRKTGVDAVHGKLPTEVQYVKDCNMCVMMTET